MGVGYGSGYGMSLETRIWRTVFFGAEGSCKFTKYICAGCALNNSRESPFYVTMASPASKGPISEAGSEARIRVFMVSGEEQ